MGPSGIVQTASMNTEIKWWGIFSDAPKGRVIATCMEAEIFDGLNGQHLKFNCMDFADLERGAAHGDSGGLVAGNGVNNRHVFGIAVARNEQVFDIVAFHRATDVEFALRNAGLPFDHFWGTALGRPDLWSPASTQCDGSC